MKSYLHLHLPVFTWKCKCTQTRPLLACTERKTENNCLNFKIPTLTLESMYYGSAVYIVLCACVLFWTNEYCS